MKGDVMSCPSGRFNLTGKFLRQNGKEVTNGFMLGLIMIVLFEGFMLGLLCGQLISVGYSISASISSYDCTNPITMAHYPECQLLKYKLSLI